MYLFCRTHLSICLLSIVLFHFMALCVVEKKTIHVWGGKNIPSYSGKKNTFSQNKYLTVLQDKVQHDVIPGTWYSHIIIGFSFSS